MVKLAITAGVCWVAFSLSAAVAAGNAQPTTLQELQDFYPRVDDAANAAFVYKKALDMCPVNNQGLFPLGGLGISQNMLITPLPSGVKADIVGALERNAAILQVLHQAAAMPQCRFPLDLTRGYGVTLPHLLPMRDFTWALELEAVNAADDKKSDLAAQAVLDAVAIAQSLRNEPQLVSQLVRINCWGIALDAMAQVLNRVSLEDKTLLQFQESLAKADDREALTRALQGELCMYMNLKTETSEDKAVHEKATAELAPPSAGQEKEDAKRDACPKPDPKLKEELVEEAKSKVEESRLPYVGIVKLLPPPFDANTMTFEQYDKQVVRTAGNKHFPAFRTFMIRAARMAAKAAAAQGVVTIERYRLKNAKLPERWEDLVPDFLPAPIQDPFVKDSALIFKITDGGYVVYSIGQNGRDDGGTEGNGRPPLDHVFRVEHTVQANK